MQTTKLCTIRKIIVLSLGLKLLNPLIKELVCYKLAKIVCYWLNWQATNQNFDNCKNQAEANSAGILMDLLYSEYKSLYILH